MAARYKQEPRARTRPKKVHGSGKSQIAVIPRQDLEPAIDEVRSRHPQVTDFQAECTRLMLHKGWSPPAIARHLQVDQQRVRYALEKQHVQTYRSELAMAALGWDAVLAQQTLAKLLHSRSQYIQLEAAKDIVSRAGLTTLNGRVGSANIQISFGLGEPHKPVIIGSARANDDPEA